MASRGFTGRTMPALTRLASASRRANPARLTSGPAALARSKASARERDSGAAASTCRGAQQIEMTAHAHIRDAMALLKRDVKAKASGANEQANKRMSRRATRSGEPILRDVRLRNRHVNVAGRVGGVPPGSRAEHGSGSRQAQFCPEKRGKNPSETATLSCAEAARDSERDSSMH